MIEPLATRQGKMINRRCCAVQD